MFRALAFCLLATLFLQGCARRSSSTIYYSGASYSSTTATRTNELRGQGSSPAAINLKQMIVPKGRVGRWKEFPLHATYITVHSTSNRGATALQHARGMLSGSFRGRTKWNRTGFMTWHFTVDDRMVIQSLPLNIQGEHADHEGLGNTTSIGIEICEFRDPRRQAAAVERAARLVAWLRREKGIPLDHVVPHYHWPQYHFHSYQKPCPRILMDGGRPGAKWNAFLRKVAGY